MKLREHGFTLPELMVVIVMTAIMTTILCAFTINFWRDGSMMQSDLETLTTRLNAGDYLREAIGNSTGLISQNSISDNHPGVADTSQPSGTYWTPLHAIPRTVSMGGTGVITPLIYFRQPSVDTSHNYIMNGAQPYDDEYVLYLDGTSKSLLVRTLANPSASGDRQKTSCPAALASSTCPADKVIATKVSSVALRYFSRTGTTIDYTSITDSLTGNYIGPDFPAVEVVEMTLTLTDKPFLQQSNSTINSTVIRVALRNS